jgi:hypothetical protein
MAWQDIVILNESWFYLSTDHELIWLLADVPVLDRERHMTQSLKLTFTVIWNSYEFNLVDALLKGMKFNCSYHVMRIFESFQEWKRYQALKPLEN